MFISQWLNLHWLPHNFFLGDVVSRCLFAFRTEMYIFWGFDSLTVSGTKHQ